MKMLILILALLIVPLKANALVVPLGQVYSTITTITSGVSTSTVVSTNGMSLVGCYLPTTFTGGTISFLASFISGGTYQELVNSSGQVKYTTASAAFIAINPVDFYGVPYFKIVSGSNEGGTRSVVCSLKGI